MMALLKYIKGYVQIRVWGFSPERFLNLCSVRGILIWDISREADTYIMCISLENFYKLRPITRKTGTRAVIQKRVGLPFFVPALKKRKMFLVGFLLCVAFWIVSSFFVWDIRVEGGYHITQEQILSYLKQNKIGPGMRKSSLQIEEMEKGLRRQFPLITWTSARLEGIRLVIQIKENDTPVIEPVQEETAGKNLIAPYTGKICSILVRSGVPKVQAGSEVKEGDILVEGRVPVYNDDATIREYFYVDADADIVLEHTQSHQESLPYRYVNREYTGRTQEGFLLQLGTQEWKVRGNASFLSYDSIVRRSRPVLFEKLSIPVFGGTITHREYQNVEHLYSEEEAKALLAEKMSEFFSKCEEKGVQILEKNVTIDSRDDLWVLDADFMVREKVCLRQEITEPEADGTMEAENSEDGKVSAE